MTRSLRRVQRLRAVVGATVVACLTCGARAGFAAAGTADQSSAEVVAARELFREATLDFDAKRYSEALQKFRRVASVRDTAQVRFNIAECEENLDLLGSALADFELASREATGDARGAETAQDALERAEGLRQRVGRLRWASASLPKEAVLTLDGQHLTLASQSVPLPVDAGTHTLAGTADGYSPYQQQVVVADGQTVNVEVTWAVAESPRAHDSVSRASTSRRTWGFVCLGGGAALAVGAFAFVESHNSAVSDVESSCPNGHCLASQRTAVEDKRSGAMRDGALAWAFSAGAAAAAGAGAILLLTGPTPSPARSMGAAPRLALGPWGASGIRLLGEF